jgi:aspartate/tyrosine/aromatic aminotransferase
MFHDVLAAEPDPIFGLLEAFIQDPRKEKVNLMVGIYKDDDLKAPLLSSVKKAKELIAEQDLMADYLPIDGLSELVSLLGPIVFKEFDQKRIYAAHTTGGTGALRAGSEFICSSLSKKICIPNHTWPNHRLVFQKAGCILEEYPYYSSEKKRFDIDSFLKYLKNLPAKTAVLLHACCHNPTGCDPSLADWEEISSLMKKKGLFPFFDFAYQGLGRGIEKDAEAVRLFLKNGHSMMVAYSCSKNFSMYCQRVGALFVVCENEVEKRNVGSHVKRIIRALYSNPPAYGARIVAEVLKREELKQLWLKDLEAMRRRITQMRQQLIDFLENRAKHLDFSYLRTHQGMFSFIDLSPSQVQRLIQKFGIYLTDNGRISVAGLSSKNIDYVVDSLLTVCEKP